MKLSGVASPVPTTAALIGCLLLLATVSDSDATLTCSDVTKDLRPCLNYLVNGSGKPPAACCAGASALASAASTSADKKAACGCIQAASQKINLKVQLAQALPGNCGINLPFSISPTTDCSKVG